MSKAAKTKTEPCQYCFKPVPKDTGHLCQECEDSLSCDVCGKNLNASGESWEEYRPDRYVHDGCKKNLGL